MRFGEYVLGGFSLIGLFHHLLLTLWARSSNLRPLKYGARQSCNLFLVVLVLRHEFGDLVVITRVVSSHTSLAVQQPWLWRFGLRWGHFLVFDPEFVAIVLHWIDCLWHSGSGRFLVHSCWLLALRSKVFTESFLEPSPAHCRFFFRGCEVVKIRLLDLKFLDCDFLHPMIL